MVNLYISKEFQEFYDQLHVVADTNKRSFAGEVGRAVKYYIKMKNDDPEIINNQALSKMLKIGTKKELIMLSTLICELNNKIIRKCQK